jgi:ABC-type amino acid transport substrate-binding protein
MRNHEHAFELFVGINPVPEVEALRDELILAPAFLTALEQRSSTMQTDRVRELPRIEPPALPEPPRRRRLAAAVAAAVVIAALVGLGAWLAYGGGGEPDVIDGPLPTTGPYGLPDFSSDPVNVGAALTAAQNSHDPEAFLSLLADDAELRSYNDVVSPDDIRAGVVLGPAGTRYGYDRAWARVMNEEEFYSCELTGDGVICDLTSTSDHLEPILPPIRELIAIQVRDGQITSMQVAGITDSGDAILEDFQAWTFEHHPAEAAVMWSTSNWAEETRTEESALLHLRLGEEYVAQLNEGGAGLAPLLETVAGDGVLTAAWPAGSGIPPFVFREDFAADVRGFEVDLVGAIAERLGLELTWANGPPMFEVMVGQGRFDVGVGAHPVTADPAGQVSLSRPYFDVQRALIVNTDTRPDIGGFADLARGDTVAAPDFTGAHYEWAVADLGPDGVEITQFTHGLGVLATQMADGTYYAAVTDAAAARTLADADPDFRVVEVVDSDDELAMVVDPQNEQLLAGINRVLQTMIDDGTYQAIYDSWFEDRAWSVAP